jgi:antitoxin VapB
MPAIARARVFQSGNSQAVRLPKQFRFRSPVVEIFRRGEEVVLREGSATLEDAFDLLAGLSRDFFAGGRKDDAPMEKRVGFKG